MEFPEHGSPVPLRPCPAWHSLCRCLHHHQRQLRPRPLAAGLCTCSVLPWCFPLTGVTPSEQQIYWEKVSKRGLQVLHTMEPKTTVMLESLLPPKTTLVLLCSLQSKAASETPIPQGFPLASRSGIPKPGRGPDPGQETQPGASQPAMLPALSPRHAIPTPHTTALQRPARHLAVPAAGACPGGGRAAASGGAGSGTRPRCTRLP